MMYIILGWSLIGLIGMITLFGAEESPYYSNFDGFVRNHNIYQKILIIVVAGPIIWFVGGFLALYYVLGKIPSINYKKDK
jgi:hypothetical protein